MSSTGPTTQPPADGFLVAEAISKRYGGAQALNGVDLTLRTGEVHGLVGANGAGKSTFIKILAGLVQPDSGRVRIDGVPIGPSTRRMRAGADWRSFIRSWPLFPA